VEVNTSRSYHNINRPQGSYLYGPVPKDILKGMCTLGGDQVGIRELIEILSRTILDWEVVQTLRRGGGLHHIINGEYQPYANNMCQLCTNHMPLLTCQPCASKSVISFMICLYHEPSTKTMYLNHQYINQASQLYHPIHHVPKQVYNHENLQQTMPDPTK
jgi:hypothetical protein